MILGIDTATAVASVALVKDGSLVVEQTHCREPDASTVEGSSPKGNHAEVLLPLIQAVLEKSGVPLEGLSGIALCIGPGSFTGLRIGLATVKGIAYEFGLPVVGVSTLHANAARVTSFDGVVCSLLDARKCEVYTALFRREGCFFCRISDDRLMSLESALAQARERHDDAARSIRFVGDGAKVYQKAITRQFGIDAAIFAGGSVAAQVARLAEGRFRARLSDDIGSLKPVYLRPSEAETKLGKTRLTY